ncbi:MAG TPA: glycosyltransferase [Bacteroidota bacterium]|nr:glycosyltransferase [Bacteroidota bacterium]
MNVLILGTAYPMRGGIAHFIALLASHLKKKHAAQIFSFKRQYPSFLFPGKTQMEEGEPGIPVDAQAEIDSINPFNWIRVGLKARRLHPDVIVYKYWLPFFGPCFGTISAIAKWRRPHTRVIAICDNVIPHEHRPGDRVFTKYAFAFTDGFLVMSDAVERDLHTLVPHPQYRKAAHPVYEIFGRSIPKREARARLGLAAEGNVLLFFGYVRKYKGLHTLIDAMAALPATLPPVTLLVVGEYYGDEKEYRDHIARLGLEDRVRVHSDYVPNERVAEYFCASDCVVLPYSSATQSGIAQIAYQFTKPVIATDVGGLAEVVIDGVSGLITRPESPALLAESIARFYEEHLEARLSAGAAEEKKKYSWDALITAIEELSTTPEGN